MEGWFELCNMRTTLLHLQFLYCHLRTQSKVQERKVERAHRDRVMQFESLCS